MFLLIIFVTLLRSAIAENSALPKSVCDVAGDLVNITDYPYQVSLQSVTIDTSIHVCSGAIIHERWIVTAASCVAGGTAEDYIILAGSSSISDEFSEDGTKHEIAKIIVHEKFDGLFNNSIAMVKVKKRFNIRRRSISIIPLLKKENKPVNDEVAVVSGWGARKICMDSLSQYYLHAAKFRIVSRKRCRAIYEKIGVEKTVSKSQICAAIEEGGEDACPGEFGSPLVIGGHLVGVSLSPPRCGVSNEPTMYTYIAHFRKWILNNIAKH